MPAYASTEAAGKPCERLKQLVLRPHLHSPNPKLWAVAADGEDSTQDVAPVRSSVAASRRGKFPGPDIDLCKGIPRFVACIWGRAGPWPLAEMNGFLVLLSVSLQSFSSEWRFRCNFDAFLVPTYMPTPLHDGCMHAFER